MISLPRRRLLAGGAAALAYNQLKQAEAQGVCGTFSPTAPAQAVAAGMTRLIFADDFNVPGTIAPGLQTSGYNWYPNTDFGATTAVGSGAGNGSPPANITVYPTATAAGITNKNSGGGSFASPGGGICVLNAPVAAANGIATMTTTAGATQQHSIPSTGVFTHWYSEIYAQFQPLFICPGQWTAWWFGTQLDSIPPGQTLLGSQELDWMEANAGNNLFTGILSERMTTSGHCFLSNNTQPFAGGDTYNGVGPTPGPAINTDNNFHLWGYLKQSTGNGSGLIHVYYDNVLQTIFSLGGADIITGSAESTVAPGKGWNWAELFQYFGIISACFFSNSANTFGTQASTFATSGNSNTLITPNLNIDYYRVWGV